MRAVTGAPRSSRLLELVAVFGTLGVIGFGGPAAHVALMRRQVVERRRWLTDAEMVDLVGITNLIPGPNSTELAMLVGRRHAGGLGLVVAGLAFIVPAAVIVLALAWGYAAYGQTPTGEALLYGVKPVIVAVVLGALVAFARTGNPSQPGLAWTPFEPDRCPTMLFDNQCRMVNDPEGEVRRIIL